LHYKICIKYFEKLLEEILPKIEKINKNIGVSDSAYGAITGGNGRLVKIGKDSCSDFWHKICVKSASCTLTQHAYRELEGGLSLCSLTLSCKFGLVNQINKILKSYSAINISCACLHRFRIKVCKDTGLAIEYIDLIF
jgi:hypothetical protein